MTPRTLRWLLLTISTLLGAAVSQTAAAAEPVAIGSRLELMVDDYLIDKRTGASLVLHHPEMKEIAIEHNAPWEGNNCGYYTVFHDGDIYRMYYMISHAECGEAERRKEPAIHTLMAAYAESKDGIHWTKPNLGQVEFAGTKNNNMLAWDYDVAEGIPAVFKDANPNCKPDARYKAVSQGNAWWKTKGEHQLRALKSPDGIHWSPLGNGPILGQTDGHFDSQNLAFWDTIQKQYRIYVRDGKADNPRDIRTATSQDFIHWTKLEWLVFPGIPVEQLYTNQVAPYYRAPHIYLGFPTRYVERKWATSFETMPELEHRKMRAKQEMRHGTAVTEGLFMSSRDGLTFRRWGEAFIRPGPQELGHWVYGDQYQNWGLVETKSDLPGAPDELSLYAIEGCWRGTSDRLRRYTIRIDGFVSLQAPLAGGECVTKPLTFSGSKLVINFASSAAGSVRVELQDADGKPLNGYRLTDCPEIFGDSLQRTVSWKSSDVSKLAGVPVRLRFVLKDADLYSFQFMQ
jgi:hypothetical protein